MKFEVRTNISNEFEKTEVVINTPQVTDEVRLIVDKLLLLSKEEGQLIGRKDDETYLINVNDIISIYSENKYVFCKTEKGAFKIKKTLYELEEKLPKDKFIRVSNSVIVNLDFVESFNTNISGTIVINLKNGDKEYTSRRRSKDIMKILE